MTIATALRALGVRDDTLTAAEKSRLDRDGFLTLPGILSGEEVAAFAGRLRQLSEAEGANAGREAYPEPGTDSLADLANKDPRFAICFTHPRVLAGVAHVLGGDLKLSSLNSRAALPGRGHQHLHSDWDAGPLPPGAYHVCNSIWLLDDFTEKNGPTRLVPGSHHWGKTPQDGMADPGAPHPDEIKIIAPAGTVVLFNGHVWHGGTRNETDRLRRAMHAFFCRRADAQQTDQRRHLRPETRARLGEAECCVLGV